MKYEIINYKIDCLSDEKLLELIDRSKRRNIKINAYDVDGEFFGSGDLMVVKPNVRYIDVEGDDVTEQVIASGRKALVMYHKVGAYGCTYCTL